jgi:hypothetical protein
MRKNKNKVCDFMIIGVMKGGTSSLSDLLAAHSGVGFSNPKEPHFFSTAGNYPAKLDQYHGLFGEEKQRLWGEGTTSYTKVPNFKVEIYKDLHEYNPELKFIYTLRHPVKRAISHYMHMYQRKAIDLSFEKALWQSNILHTGRFYTQLRPFVELFGREQVYLYKFEDFISDQQSVFDGVLGYLGLSPELIGAPSHNNSALGANKVGGGMDRFKTRAIRKIWDEKIPENVKSSVYRAAAKLTARTFDEKINISPATERQILDFHRDDVLSMEDWMQTDLSDYLTSSDGTYNAR